MIERSGLEAKLVGGLAGKPLRTVRVPNRESAEYVEVLPGMPVVIRLTIGQRFDWKASNYLKVQAYLNSQDPLPISDIEYPIGLGQPEYTHDISTFQMWDKGDGSWYDAAFAYRHFGAETEGSDMPAHVRNRIGEIRLSIKRCTRAQFVEEKAKQPLRPILPNRTHDPDIQYSINVSTKRTIGTTNPESLKPLEGVEGNWINFSFLPRAKDRNENKAVNETQGESITLKPRSELAPTRGRQVLSESGSDLSQESPIHREDSTEAIRSHIPSSHRHDHSSLTRRFVHDTNFHIAPTSSSTQPQHSRQGERKDRHTTIIPNATSLSFSRKRSRGNGGKPSQSPTKIRKVNGNASTLPSALTSIALPSGAGILNAGHDRPAIDLSGAETQANIGGEEQGRPGSQVDERNDSVSVYEDDRAYQNQRRLERELDRMSRDYVESTREANRLLLARYRRTEQQLEEVKRSQNRSGGDKP